jgi:hypothetical protein
MSRLFVAVAIVSAILSCSAAQSKTVIAPAEYSRDPILQGPEAAECKTGAPCGIVYGIGQAESSGNPNPRHRIKTVQGKYGLDERYHPERERKYGRYDPLDPYDAAYITARLYLDNLRILKVSDFAVAAHLQGPTGVKRNGPIWSYVYKVMGKEAFSDYR